MIHSQIFVDQGAKTFSIFDNTVVPATALGLLNQIHKILASQLQVEDPKQRGLEKILVRNLYQKVYTQFFSSRFSHLKQWTKEGKEVIAVMKKIEAFFVRKWLFAFTDKIKDKKLIGRIIETTTDFLLRRDLHSLILVSRGDKDDLQMLLIKHPDENGDTPILHAMKKRPLNWCLIETLSDKGAQYAMHEILCHTSECYEKAKSVHRILSSTKINFDVDQCNPKNLTALHAAVEGNELKYVKQILERNPLIDLHDSRGYTPLALAMKKQNPGIVEALKSAGAQFDPQADNVTVLHWAAFGGDEEAVEFFCKHVDVDRETKSGYTPLYYATRAPSTAAMLVLLRHRASVYKGHTFQRLVCDAIWDVQKTRESCRQFLNILLQHGFMIDSPNKDGYTALQVVAIFDDLPMATYLLENKANPDIATQLGDTALHLAAWRGHGPMIQLLLQHGADFTMIGGDEMTMAQIIEVRRNKAKSKKP